MNTIKLQSPLLVNDQGLEELTYDFSKLDETDLLDVIANCHFGQEAFSALLETDYSLHMWLIFKAIIKVNPSIDIEDLKRITGKDCIKLVGIGRDFFNEQSISENSVELDSRVFAINSDSLITEQYMAADVESRLYANKIQKPCIMTAGNDMAFHLYLGYYLLASANEVSVESLRKLQMADLIKIMLVGRNFIIETLAEEYTTKSQQEKSEKLSEGIPESTTAE